jgi:imidazolonepropionase-like amidohydrolase
MNPMMNRSFGRRDFIKYAIFAGAALSMPSLQGCAIPKKNVPLLDDKKTFLIKNAGVIDIQTGAIETPGWLIIDNGVIVRKGIGEFKEGFGGIVFDLKGRYLMPGLIDAHCHSTSSPVFSLRMLDILKHSDQQRQNFVSSIESGVTTIRDMGAFPALLRMFIKDIEKGNLPGPRVVYCNSILNLMGAHPEIPPSDVNIFARPASWFIGMMMTNFQNTEELKTRLEENARGASFIKLTLDNQTLFCKTNKKIPVYTDEQLKIIFDFAEKKGLPVSGHHQFKFGFDRAMQYPFHSLEHIVTDTVLSDDDILQMARRKVAIVPTMTVGQSYLMEEAYDELPAKYQTPEILEELRQRRYFLENEATMHCDPVLHGQNLKTLSFYKKYPIDHLWEKKIFLVNPVVYFNMIQNGYANLKKMNDAGILIGCGIDAGMPLCYFGSNYREYEILKRVGLTPLEILRCATINNAKILQLDDKTGSLETGKYGDMLVLEKNPLEDIRALRRPYMVFKQGELMFSAADLRLDGILPA